jgi:hypothetical protein
MVLKKKPVKKSVKASTLKNDDAVVRPKKSSKATLITVVSVLVVLTVFAALIFVPELLQKQKQEDSKYNNFEFEQYEDGLWGVRVEVNTNPYLVLMHYHPTEVDTIKVEQGAVDVINALATKVAVTGEGQVYITMDPDAPAGLAIAGVELAKVLGEKYGIYNIPTKAAFSKPKEGFGQSIPIITCQDAVNDTFVVYIREAENEYVGVPQDFNQCIVVQGSSANETIRVADRLVYALFNIIPAG